MRSCLLASIATAALLVASAGAFAADTDSSSSSSTSTSPSGAASQLMTSDGWYVGGSGGLSFLEPSANRSSTVNFDASANNPGFDVNGAIGRKFDDGFRLEGEIGYRQIGLDHITSYTGSTTGSAGGNANALSFMANAYYDFQTGGPITPYVGGGLGVARVSMSGVTMDGASLVDDTDTVLAYQAIGGVGYQLSPEGTLFAQYRYFATDEPTFTDSSGQRFKSDFDSHNLEVGYRWSF